MSTGSPTHQSGHSSGVIHAGIYYAPGSLKARLCVAGAARLYAYCEERGIEARRERQGDRRHASSPSCLASTSSSAAGPRTRSRACGGSAPTSCARSSPTRAGISALHSPATGVVDFRAVTEAMAADLRDAGGRDRDRLRGAVDLRATGTSVSIRHSAGSTEAAKTVLCAGPWADRLAVAAGADPDPRVVPFRGAYLRLKPARADLVRASIYPVPDPELPFLGMHLTRGPDGEVLLGPTALLVGARDAYRLAAGRPPRPAREPDLARAPGG